jgi:hypothetical protein
MTLSAQACSHRRGSALALAIAAFLAIGAAPVVSDAAELNLKKQDIGKVKKFEPESEPKKLSPKPQKTLEIKPAKPSPSNKPKKASIKPEKLNKQITKPAAGKLKKLDVKPKGGEPSKNAAIKSPGNINKKLIKPSAKALAKELKPARLPQQSPDTDPLKSRVTATRIEPTSDLTKKFVAPSVKDLVVKPRLDAGNGAALDDPLKDQRDGDRLGIQEPGAGTGVVGGKLRGDPLSGAEGLVGDGLQEKGQIGKARVLKGGGSGCQDGGTGECGNSPMADLFGDDTRGSGSSETGSTEPESESGSDYGSEQFTTWTQQRNCVGGGTGGECGSYGGERGGSSSSDSSDSPYADDPGGESGGSSENGDGGSGGSSNDSYAGDSEPVGDQSCQDGSGGDSGECGAAGGSRGGDDDASDAAGVSGSSGASDQDGYTPIGAEDENPSGCGDGVDCDDGSPGNESGDGTIRMGGQQGGGGPLAGGADTAPADGTLRLANEEDVSGETARGDGALNPTDDDTLRLPEGEEGVTGTPQVDGGAVGDPAGSTGARNNIQEGLNLETGELEVNTDSLEGVSGQVGQ